MRHLFVPHHIAVMAKEKGFDVECLGYYNVDPHLKNPAFNQCKPFKHEWCVAAPLYQQMVDWFRTTHKLYIQTHKVRNFIDESHCWHVDYIDIVTKIHRSYPTDRSMVGVREKDYYTALTKAIEEAFTLI